MSDIKENTVKADTDTNVAIDNLVRSYAAKEAGAPLERYDYDAGELAIDEVEIDVSHCGICH